MQKHLFKFWVLVGNWDAGPFFLLPPWRKRRLLSWRASWSICRRDEAAQKSQNVLSTSWGLLSSSHCSTGRSLTWKGKGQVVREAKTWEAMATLPTSYVHGGNKGVDRRHALTRTLVITHLLTKHFVTKDRIASVLILILTLFTTNFLSGMSFPFPVDVNCFKMFWVPANLKISLGQSLGNLEVKREVQPNTSHNFSSRQCTYSMWSTDSCACIFHINISVLSRVFQQWQYLGSSMVFLDHSEWYWIIRSHLGWLRGCSKSFADKEVMGSGTCWQEFENC